MNSFFNGRICSPAMRISPPPCHRGDPGCQWPRVEFPPLHSPHSRQEQRETEPHRRTREKLSSLAAVTLVDIPLPGPPRGRERPRDSGSQRELAWIKRVSQGVQGQAPRPPPSLCVGGKGVGGQGAALLCPEWRGRTGRPHRTGPLRPWRCSRRWGVRNWTWLLQWL